MAKLSDFGSSILHLDDKSSDGRLYEEFRGTEYFFPPERDTRRLLLANLAKAADVYCWGMLLWQIIVDGGYRDENGIAIGSHEMAVLRRSRNVPRIAAAQVESYVNLTHPDETRDKPYIKAAIVSMLQATLVHQPDKRSSAIELLEQAEMFTTADTERLRTRFVKALMPLALATA